MTDLNAMVLFARVVEHGGFSKAARALSLQPSLLSRAVAELEAELGVRLLNRTTRRMSVTDVGQTFYLHCAALAAEAEAAREAVEQTRSNPRGLVRMSCPAPMLAAGLDRVVTAYVRDHPAVRLHVEVTGRRVNLVEEGFDLAVRVRPLPLEDTSDTIRQLATTSTRLVAHPRLLEGRSMPTHPDDLQDWPTVDMTAAGDRHAWPMTSPEGKAMSFAHRPRLMADDFGTLRLAALEGIGIARLPGYVAQADVTTGRLLSLLPGWVAANALVHVAFPSRRGLVPAVRALIEAIAEAFAADRVCV